MVTRKVRRTRKQVVLRTYKSKVRVLSNLPKQPLAVVVDRDTLPRDCAEFFKHRWLVQCRDGTVFGFDTKGQANGVQRQLMKGK